MRIGVPKERKPSEGRVALTPSGAADLVLHGHEVWVEKGAGELSGFSDLQYQEAGAKIVPSPQKVFQSELIIKVKEPQAEEVPLLSEGQILFTYLHLAAHPALTRALLRKKVVAIAYETITDAEGKFPLLAPMSQIAGRLAVDLGALFLQSGKGGKGKYLGRVTGIPPAKIVIIGGGVVGTEAGRVGIGRGAEVILFERDYHRLARLDFYFSSLMKFLYPSPPVLREAVAQADLLIGAVFSAGHQAPKVIGKELVQKMEPGSVVIDVAIDQGGCIETSKPTTHAKPIRNVEGILHYAVPNIPSLVPRTATEALSTATYPYILSLAEKGWKKALLDNPHFMMGLNVCLGATTHPAIAEDLHMPYTFPESICSPR